MEELINLEKWIQTNRMSSIVKKTHSMMFSSSTNIDNRQNNLYVEGTIIDTVIVTKFLGLDIDKKTYLEGPYKHCLW